MGVIQWFRKTFLGEVEPIEPQAPANEVLYHPGEATITAPKVLTVKAPEVAIEGNLTVTGTVATTAAPKRTRKKATTKKSKK